MDTPNINPHPQSDEPTADVELCILAAQVHGSTSAPDHEVGDLQECLRDIWAVLPPALRHAFMASASVRDRLEGNLPEEMLQAFEALLQQTPPPDEPDLPSPPVTSLTTEDLLSELNRRNAFAGLQSAIEQLHVYMDQYRTTRAGDVQHLAYLMLKVRRDASALSGAHNSAREVADWQDKIENHAY